jgi:hypothetical protein
MDNVINKKTQPNKKNAYWPKRWRETQKLHIPTLAHRVVGEGKLKINIITK